ncbi:MAG: hypothetical protein IME93_06190 [Proteobacteria bacterium]|nr:hypothetical protein [Pseudomonadota bacterium]
MDTAGQAGGGNPLPSLNTQQKESLTMVIVLQYAEQNALLDSEQLEDARASLRALFLRATGEETMLRKIIDMLRINHSLNKSFGEISQILDGVDKARATLTSKIRAIEKSIEQLSLPVEANNSFASPFYDFSDEFLRNVSKFEHLISEYREAKENEARLAHDYRLAHEARERLKHRFDGKNIEENEHEKEVKDKVYKSFNYGKIESDYQYAKRSADHVGREIKELLAVFKVMCHMAMKPDMRSPDTGKIGANSKTYPDVYSISSSALKKYEELRTLASAIQELLRLYHHSFGMFVLDLNKFNKAIIPMIENIEDYTHAKEMDEDVRHKQDKLEKIKALVAFIEAVALILKKGKDYTYPKFSSLIAATIDQVGASWEAIAEELLRMKVIAEAELSTRIS